MKLCGACKEDLREQISCQRTMCEGDSTPVYFASGYESVMRSLVLKWKDHGRLDLGAYIRGICALLTRYYLQEAGSVPRGQRFIVVPAPSSPSAMKARGRLHTEEIAAAVVRELRASGYRAKTVQLLKQKNIKKQVNYDASSRKSNKQNALRLKRFTSKRLARELGERSEHRTVGSTEAKATPNERRKVRSTDLHAPDNSVKLQTRRPKVILVDDISTTGATLAVCQSTLEQARWHVDCALTLTGSITCATA